MTKRNKQTKPKKTPKSAALTFSDHVGELRRRLLWVGLVFAIVSSLAYNYHEQLVQIVMAPLHGQKLVYLTPAGGFSFIFQVTLYAGLIASAPMIVYQIYGFIRPTLPEYAKKGALRVALFTTLLMVVGVSYGYFIAVPAALTFLSTFAGADIVPTLTADAYFSFFLSYIGGLALLFQLPLLLIFWHWINPMTPTGLLKSERVIILFAFIAAALITPTPDVVNQTMIAGPLIGLYQIGVLVVLVSILRSRKKRSQTPTSDPPVQKEQSIVSTNKPNYAPVPRPIGTPIPQTVSFAPASLPHRSIDGFTVSKSLRPPTQRSLAIPPRPTPRQHQPLQRRRLSIDGISASNF